MSCYIYLYRIPNSGHIVFTRIKKKYHRKKSDAIPIVMIQYTDMYPDKCTRLCFTFYAWLYFVSVHSCDLLIDNFQSFFLRHSYDYTPSVRDMWLMWNKGITPLLVPKVTFWCTDLSRSTAPLQYPIRRFMERSRIVLKYDEVSIEFLSDRTIRYTNLAVSRLMITKIPHIKK